MATVPDGGKGVSDARLSLPLLTRREAVLSANNRGFRGYSRKLQDMLKQQEREIRGKEEGRKERRKFEPRSWKQLGPKELGGMSSIERSRFMAYEPVPKDVQEKQAMALTRVRAARALERMCGRSTLAELIEAEKNDELVGQLKAAEAIQRTRKSRTYWERTTSEELEHLVSSQPTAMKAVRLETMMSLHHTHPVSPHLLTKAEQNRVQTLLEDSSGYSVARTV